MMCDTLMHNVVYVLYMCTHYLSIFGWYVSFLYTITLTANTGSNLKDNLTHTWRERERGREEERERERERGRGREGEGEEERGRGREREHKSYQ